MKYQIIRHSNVIADKHWVINTANDILQARSILKHCREINRRKDTANYNYSIKNSAGKILKY